MWLVASQLLTADLAVERAEAHLLIHNEEAALHEIETLEETRELLEEKIRLLARLGKEREMVEAFYRYGLFADTPYKNSTLLEEMAWGVIEKGFSVSAPVTRVVALLAAKTANSARGVKLLEKGITDPHAGVRTVAMQFVSSFRDQRLQEAVVHAIQTEKSFPVRLAAITAAGKMKNRLAEPAIRSLLARNDVGAEELAAAAVALSHITEDPSREEIFLLARAPRVGLRLLACELVANFEKWDDLDLIVPLVHDHSALIRKAALQVLGISRENGYWMEARELLQDPNSQVATIAAWVLIVHDDTVGVHAMLQILRSSQQEERVFASGVLQNLGVHGSSLLHQAFDESSDPFVKLNAAIGLIGSRTRTPQASSAILSFLQNNKERLMWEEEGIFRLVKKSEVAHREEVPGFPEIVNQLGRLELLQLLAFLQHPSAPAAMKQLLVECPVGITGVAVALMLTEAEEESLALIRALLNDPDPLIRAQAALILALWGREPEVIAALEEVYATGNRLIREKVLEGMGHIGSPKTLPFLVERLLDPHQQMRLIAASAIIETLNH